MHRRQLTALLQRFAAEPDAADLAARFATFVAAHRDCLLRSCAPGHITASAWILSADGRQCLLTHHRKLDRWLQLGGHVDGEPRVERAALREAREESGMTGFELLVPAAAGPAAASIEDLVPLDLDVHPIPARGTEPEHLHWDVRFLLRAAPGQRLVVSAESKALAWIDRDAVAALTGEESVLRLERRARRWLAGGLVDVLRACDLGSR